MSETMVRVVIIICVVFTLFSAVLMFASINPLVEFVVSGVGIVLLAIMLGWSTEELSSRIGPVSGGLLNATMGNGAEIIVGIVGLKAGLSVVVKASITGSIIGNLLLVWGLSALVGGISHKVQHFSIKMASMNSNMMALAVAALVIPSIFFMTVSSAHLKVDLMEMSLVISIVLIIIYLASLLFIFRTHRHQFLLKKTGMEERMTPKHESPFGWSLPRSVLTLIFSGVGLFFAAEVLVGAIEPTIVALGWGEIFMGVVIVAIIANAAEHSSAVLFAYKDNMDLSFAISSSSAQQIALLVAPFLVLISLALGSPMDLVFEPLELVAIAFAVVSTVLMSNDGRSNWIEGLQLLGLYLVLAVAFFFL